MPLVRYEIGDYAIAGPTCPCGRGLPVVKQVLGRRRNLFRFSGGITRWTSYNNDAYRELENIAPVSEFQVTQTSLDRLTLNVVVAKTLTSEQGVALSEWLMSSLDHRCQVTVKRAKPAPG